MILSEENFAFVRADVEKLLRYFKEPQQTLSKNLDYGSLGTGVNSGLKNNDTFVFASDLQAIQQKFEDNAYRLEKSFYQVFDKMGDIEARLRIRKTETPLEVNEEWHAELKEDALKNVEKL